MKVHFLTALVAACLLPLAACGASPSPSESRQSTTARDTLPDEEPVPERKGLLLSKLRIPADEIHDGGPPRDGIPSIDEPKFVRPEDADFINARDYVLGVSLNGVAKAYPIRILNYHEIVNDHFGEQAVVITYCPLCGSGMAFSAEINGQEHRFGVSGLLYNSDMLLYDRQTESLWSQIESMAVAGPQSGQPLELIPTTYSTWREWLERHPHSLVLSTDTGYRRDYSRTPYPGYDRREALMFPVKEENPVLHRKERVIGLEIKGQYKAYPFSRLEQKDTPVRDVVNGQTVLVHYNKQEASAYITDEQGEELPSASMFWFAWYAFHPETALYGE